MNYSGSTIAGKITWIENRPRPEDGGAGVREPRRPKPRPPMSGGMERPMEFAGV